MSVHVSSAVWKLRLSSTEKLVLLKLADNANEDGSHARPSVNTIAVECGLAERTAQRILRKLQAAGLLEIQHKHNRYYPTTYRVCPQRGAILTPLDYGRGDPDGTSGVILSAPGVYSGSPDPSYDPSIEPSRDQLRKVAAPDRSLDRASERPGSAAASKNENDDLFDAIRSGYEDTIGSISAALVGELADWAERLPAGDRGVALAADAFREAAAHNARSWAYVRSVLQRWERDGWPPKAARDARAGPSSPVAAEPARGPAGQLMEFRDRDGRITDSLGNEIPQTLFAGDNSPAPYEIANQRHQERLREAQERQREYQEYKMRRGQA